LTDGRYRQNLRDVSYKISQQVIIKNPDAIRLLKHIRKLADRLSKLGGIQNE